MTRILVIDDDFIVRETIVRVLQKVGYDVISAMDGKLGIETFNSEHPDLVITDIIMPEKEGLQTITEIRNINPDAKIIAISGGGRVGNTDLLSIARSLGVFEAIAKPFTPKELVNCVGRCLNGH